MPETIIPAAQIRAAYEEKKKKSVDLELQQWREFFNTAINDCIQNGKNQLEWNLNPEQISTDLVDALEKELINAGYGVQVIFGWLGDDEHDILPSSHELTIKF
jgi:hypothetical protein